MCYLRGQSNDTLPHVKITLSFTLLIFAWIFTVGLTIKFVKKNEEGGISRTKLTNFLWPEPFSRIPIFRILHFFLFTFLDKLGNLVCHMMLTERDESVGCEKIFQL